VNDLKHRIETLFTIPDKKNRVVKFKLWKNQADFLERAEAPGAPRRRVHLKSRQVGESSIIQGRNYLDAMSTPNFTVLVICQDKATRELFRFHARHHWDDLNRRKIAPTKGTDNEDMMEFPILGSRIIFETAEGQGVGRAWTVNRLHATEVAHWKHPAKTLTGAMQSVPDDGEIDIESTPYGAGGPFHRAVKAAAEGKEFEDAVWEFFFYPWWWTAEYTDNNNEPLDDLSEHEEWLIGEHNLTFGQIRWRRKKATELEMAGEPFEQEYPEDYLTCFLGGAKLVFSAETIKAVMRDVREPVAKVNPNDPSKPGQLWVWKKPRGSRHYIIPADISEGIGQDKFAAPVIDNETLEVVAAYYDDRTDPVEAARVLDGMGRWYNNALVCPETAPGVGYTTGKRLELDYSYPNLYYHIDPRTGHLGDVGWKTDARTRPLIQGALMDHVPTNSVLIRDPRAVSEMSSLVWESGEDSSKRPKMKAVSGEHDDYVMALGIGLCVREITPMGPRPEPQAGIRRLQ
jgi:hypothetical protein